MKRILYLTFYFEPDLCAGSFRNTPLVKELAKQVKNKAEVDVITTLPNRYSTFDVTALQFEKKENYNMNRIKIPVHRSGMVDQIKSFTTYYLEAKKLIKGKKYDLVVASSSRLFTAYLGYRIAKKIKVPLYLDVRDIFVDTLKDVLQNTLVRLSVLPILKIIEKKSFGYASHINLISAGFADYFKKYHKPEFSFFSNGIDNEFLNLTPSGENIDPVKTITYAGNIGEGQGLHKIVPEAASRLKGKYRFLIIGDGGAKQKLMDGLKHFNVSNVEILPPVKRTDLMRYYHEADFLFIHLNDYDAFKKVLPSKVFEMGAYDKPVIAGVAGYANKFINENISNRILFLPGDVDDLVSQISSYKYKNEIRSKFIENYKRDNINKGMAASMVKYL